LDARGLQKLLEGLGLQPTQRGVAALMRQLAAAPAGLVPRQAFLQFVLTGGRCVHDAQAAEVAAQGGGAAAKHRRADTLYRVWSIEAYTLAGALSELSASGLAPGVRQAGASTLRELAAAHHAQREAEAAPRDQGEAQPAVGGGGEGRLAASSSQLIPLGTADSPVLHLHLPGQSPFGQEDGGGQEAEEEAANAAPSRERQAALDAADGGSQPSQPPPPQQQQAPLVVEVQPVQAARRGGPLAWLGLAGPSPLRSTPSAAAQFGILLLRSGEAGRVAGRAAGTPVHSCQVPQGLSRLIPPAPRHQVGPQLQRQDAGAAAAHPGCRCAG
jgi:hypothetical protein